MMSIKSILSVFVVLLTSHAQANNYLTPPGEPGSPAARMRTLNEVQPSEPISALPYVITNSGTYYLTGHLSGTNGYSGIRILADNVTLDLNGFSLYGGPGTEYGIEIAQHQLSIRIQNGILREWGYYGVYGGSAENCSYIGLTTISNGWDANCSGIYAGPNSQVLECIASGNKSYGIFAGNGSSVRNCKAYQNGNRGINAADGSTVSGCSAYENGNSGIAAYNGSTITQCSAYKNSNAGIVVYQGSTVSDSAAYQNGLCGIEVGAGVTVINCTSSQNGSYGYWIESGCIVSKCSAYRNGGHGFYVRSNAFLTENIAVASGYQVGPAAGIYLAFSGNRIQNNQLIENDIGIQANQGANFISGNVVKANTTAYDLTGTQTIGPIITTTGTITNQNPWANFEF